MPEIKFSNLTESEKSQFKEETDGDKPGHGILLTGKYYIAAYQPVDDSDTGKCIGVEVFIHKIQETNSRRIPSIKVLFKQSWLSIKEPFKDRLQSAVKTQTNTVVELDKEIDDEVARVIKQNKEREEAIVKHTKNVRSCKLKIDSTIKAVAPNAKSLIDYKNEQLLVEKAAEDASRLAIKNPKVEETKIPPKPPISDYCTHKSEKEKQTEVNDYILNRESFYKPVKKPTPPDIKQPKDFIKEMRDIKQSNEKIIYVEPLSLTDIRYMTNLEKQQSVLNKEVALATNEILG